MLNNAGLILYYLTVIQNRYILHHNNHEQPIMLTAPLICGHLLTYLKISYAINMISHNIISLFLFCFLYKKQWPTPHLFSFFFLNKKKVHPRPILIIIEIKICQLVLNHCLPFIRVSSIEIAYQGFLI